MKLNFVNRTIDPFFHDPLKRDFGFKGLTPQASRVMAGVYECNETIPEAEQQLLEALEMPSSIRSSGTQSMDISLASYRSFWRKSQRGNLNLPRGNLVFYYDSRGIE